MTGKFFIALFLLLPTLAFSNASYAEADKYTFDKDHTHVIFFISHLGFSHMVGRVKDYDGYFTFDESSPEKSEVDVTLKPDSIDTDVPALDKELRGSKFFDVAQFPTMHFKGSKVTVIDKDKKMADVAGEFTMLGVVRPLTLHVTYNKSGVHPFTNNYVSGFTAEAKLKRSDFGMNAYQPAVGDDVLIHIEVEGIDPAKHPGSAKTDPTSASAPAKSDK